MSHNRAGSTASPVEKKVTWSTLAAALAGLLTTLAATLASGEDHGVVLRFLPEWLEPIVMAGLTALPTLAAGWSAPHTHRPDLLGPLP